MEGAGVSQIVHVCVWMHYGGCGTCRVYSTVVDCKLALFSFSDPIAEDDYFLKSSEFRKWLSQEVNALYMCVPILIQHTPFRYIQRKWLPIMSQENLLSST